MNAEVIVIGSGPNGLSAAIELARAGISVSVLEAKETIGGGTRTAELTLPGFLHDICSAIQPMAVLSPFFQTLDLKGAGLDWIFPPAALAHPLPDGSAAMLYQDIVRTSETLGVGGKKYQELFLPFLRSSADLFSNILAPIRLPKKPVLLAKFGLLGLRSCTALVASRLNDPLAGALFTGCAAHSFLPMSAAGSASFGLALAIAGHAVGWPCAKGGSQKISEALANCFRRYDGEIKTGINVHSMKELPVARAYVFDVTPRQLMKIAEDELPASYRKRLANYRYGPGVFKVDWALKEPIPWRNRDCAQAGTVHVGGTVQQIASSENDAWQGRHSQAPFTIVAQQSLFDVTRAPHGKHVAWGYCHVPNGSTLDMTDIIERQIETFAPGFRDVVLARHTFNTREFEDHNANFIGGDIAGGANTLRQVLARPVIRYNPYSTPNPKIFLCSSSTPPGGGVHGMCGFLAARSILKKVYGHR